MNKRVFVITRDLSGPDHGGQIVAKRNLLLLQNIFDKSNVDIAFVKRPSPFHRLHNFLLQSSYGNCAPIWKHISSYDFKSCRFVFIDGSLEGTIVKYLRGKNVPVIVFYHNVEQKYYQDRFAIEPSIGSWLMKRYAARQEKTSTLHASYRITLNQRDSTMLKEKYGIGADYILPTSFDDPGMPSAADSEGKPYALFIGSNFYANSDGIRWFIKKVLPYIKIDLYVAGSVSDSLADIVAQNKYSNLKVLGFVDDLQTLYRNASCVVSPIFAGSGLKTKTVEALMYGKVLLGSDEAFQGINADYSQIGGKCNTAQDFVERLNAIDPNIRGTCINLYSYKVFQDSFSTNWVQNGFKSFLRESIV